VHQKMTSLAQKGAKSSRFAYQPSIHVGAELTPQNSRGIVSYTRAVSKLRSGKRRQMCLRMVMWRYSVVL